MSRRDVIIGCLTAFALIAWRCDPGHDTVGSIGATFALAPDSTVKATATVSLTGALQVGDTLRYRFFKDGVVAVTSKAVVPTATASMPAPAYLQTSAYKACAQLLRRTVLMGVERCSANWSYTRPDLPLPVVDSVQIVPASVTLSPGQAFQFSARVFQS